MNPSTTIKVGGDQTITVTIMYLFCCIHSTEQTSVCADLQLTNTGQRDLRIPPSAKGEPRSLEEWRTRHTHTHTHSVIKDAKCLLKSEASKHGEVLNEIESVNRFDDEQVCVRCCEDNQSTTEENGHEIFNRKSATIKTKTTVMTTAASTEVPCSRISKIKVKSDEVPNTIYNMTDKEITAQRIKKNLPIQKALHNFQGSGGELI